MMMQRLKIPASGFRSATGSSNISFIYSQKAVFVMQRQPFFIKKLMMQAKYIFLHRKGFQNPWGVKKTIKKEDC